MSELSKKIDHLSLSNNTRDFIASLQKGNTEDALRFLEAIYREKDETLFQQIGKMTRSVHDAIVNFHIESTGKNEENSEKISKMVDASDRLQFVIKTTENAANKTMDMIEDSLPISHSLGIMAKELQIQWKKFISSSDSLANDNNEKNDLFLRVDEFLVRAGKDTKSLEHNLHQILLAQDFQDITGQVLKKVIFLVRDIEENLVDLVKVSAGLEIDEIKVNKPNKVVREKDSRSELEGPVMDKSRTDVVTNQDDVDDLLSSLGF